MMTDDDFTHTMNFFNIKTPRYLTYLTFGIFFMIIVFFIWSAVFEIDLVVKTKAIIRPLDNISIIKCARSGFLQSKLFKNGEHVDAGQTLYILNANELRKDRTNSLVKQKRLKSSITSLLMYEKLINGTAKIPCNDLDATYRYNAYSASLSHLVSVRNQADKYLHDELLLPRSMTTTQKISDLTFSLKASEDALNEYLANELIKVLTEKKDLISDEESIENHIASIQEEEQKSIILSPINGVVEELQKLNTGEYISEGEDILRIIPTSSKIVKVNIHLDIKDIPEIQKGMEVVLRFEGLPPSNFGQAKGVISRVSEDSLVVNNNLSYYEIEATLSQNYLDSKRDGRVYLRPGMTAEAKIIVKHKKILVYLLEKLEFLL